MIVLKSVQAILTVCAVLCLFVAAPARAVAPLGDDGLSTDNVKAHLVAETSAIVPGETFFIALHLEIKEHWHTYWRFAGDSGAATTVELDMPDGFSAGEILWPIPRAVPLGPLMNFGYEAEAFHLIPITAPSVLLPGSTVNIRAAAEWLVCSDEVCLPEWGTLELSLPVAPAGQSVRPDSKWGARIADAVDTLPAAAPYPVSYSVDGQSMVFALHDAALAEALQQNSVEAVRYFPFADGVIRHAAPQELMVGAEGVSLRIEGGYLVEKDELPDPVDGVIVVTEADGSRTGFEIAAEKGAPIPGGVLIASLPMNTGAAQGGGVIGGLTALAFAFIGGLILNLMPCVFPILSMKILGFIERAQADASALRRHGWFFAFGVLSSFFALALALLTLRAGGAQIGWGFQLQSPLVVVLLAYLMFAVGLSLSGIISFAGGVAGVGESLTRKAGASGAFFTGVLAALVATPCTAPFMSAAMGYAFVAPPVLGLSVFLALGAGLAAPYLLMCHFPSAFGWLPRPGVWMTRLKEGLAFPMYATAAWLVWVFAQQVGTEGMLAALMGLVLIGFGVWFLRSFSKASGSVLWIGRAAAALLIVCALVLPNYAMQMSAGAPAKNVSAGNVGELPWEAYDAAKLQSARAVGRATFVYLTAAWCITCKVNERFVLASHKVQAAFAAHNVLIMKGDWTERDEKITQLLSEYGRAGVPLYLFFDGSEGGAAQILPQILTEDTIIAAIRGT